MIWCCRLRPQWWETLTTMAHTLCAWASLDVMAISMVLTLIEMSTSDFHHLGPDDRMRASKLIGTHVNDYHGVGIEITLEYGTYIILVAVVVHWFAGRVMMDMVERAVV